MPEKLGAYSGGIRAATSQFSGAGEGGPKLIAFEADVTNNAKVVSRSLEERFGAYIWEVVQFERSENKNPQYIWAIIHTTDPGSLISGLYVSSV